MSNVKIIEVKTFDLRDPEAAEQLGRAILSATAESTSTREIPDDSKTAVDGLDSDAYRAVKETAEYKAFAKEFNDKINDLNDFVRAHQKAYNCAIVIASTSICGDDLHSSGLAVSGRGDAIREAFCDILGNDDMREILERIQAKRRLIDTLRQATAESPESSTPENESPKNS